MEVGDGGRGGSRDVFIELICLSKDRDNNGYAGESFQKSMAPNPKDRFMASK